MTGQRLPPGCPPQKQTNTEDEQDRCVTVKNRSGPKPSEQRTRLVIRKLVNPIMPSFCMQHFYRDVHTSANSVSHTCRRATNSRSTAEPAPQQLSIPAALGPSALQIACRPQCRRRLLLFFTATTEDEAGQASDHRWTLTGGASSTSSRAASPAHLLLRASGA